MSSGSEKLQVYIPTGTNAKRKSRVFQMRDINHIHHRLKLRMHMNYDTMRAKVLYFAYQSLSSLVKCQRTAYVQTLHAKVIREI